jgi:benzodiazapine receptor
MKYTEEIGVELVMKKINWMKLVIAILIPQLAGGIGALFTTPKIQGWYAGLNKPFFQPPNWLFGPVWTILFLLMGIALYMVWNEKSLNDKVFNWFWIQLLLNMLWSLVFFGWEMPGVALIVIVFLWIAIRKTMRNFPLQFPYLMWVSFATILNAGVWWLNR